MMLVVACQRPITSGAIIDRYGSARCVEPTIVKGVNPPTRGWDATLTTARGAQVIVSGADRVGGLIALHYQPNGPEVIAANPGDYIYPSDVRIDDRRTILYIKARGLAGGIWKQTWLYAYHLDERRQISRVRVEPGVLPAECPTPKAIDKPRL
jgi:hypothetical protein